MRDIFIVDIQYLKSVWLVLLFLGHQSLRHRKLGRTLRVMLDRDWGHWNPLGCHRNIHLAVSVTHLLNLTL